MKYLLYSIIIFMFIIDGCEDNKDNAPKQEKAKAILIDETKRQEEIEKSIPILDPNNLYIEYLQNRVAVNEKYQGKTIKIKGFITQIDRNSFNELYIFIAPNLVCYFPESNIKQVLSARVSQEIVIKGIFGSYEILPNNFIAGSLSKCSIVIEKKIDQELSNRSSSDYNIRKSPEYNEENDKSEIENLIKKYFKKIEYKLVGEAADCFISSKREKIVTILSKIAEETEYYRINRIEVSNTQEAPVTAKVALYQKKWANQIDEFYPVTMEVIKEGGSWKIVSSK